jgi:hypothetical protein
MKENEMSDYTVKMTYSDSNETEYTVYNAENNAIGYYVVTLSNNDIEVYSVPDIENELYDDYLRVDNATDIEDAFEIIVTNYEYA